MVSEDYFDRPVDFDLSDIEGARVIPNYEVPLEIRADWTTAKNIQRTPDPYLEALLNEEEAIARGHMTRTPVTQINKRAELLQRAESIINGDRNVQYGDPNADFNCTAQLWDTYLDRVYARQKSDDQFVGITGQDVAIMMILLKVSRIGWSPDKADHWLDIAGYAACGYDCSDAQLEAS